MITEDYVSFEVAKLLKRAGFDWKVNHRWQNWSNYADTTPFFLNALDYYEDSNDDVSDDAFSAPTLQMAMKWLREEHNIAIDTEWEHMWYAYIKPMTSEPFNEDYYQCASSKYEEACEAAIKYCLENLI